MKKSIYLDHAAGTPLEPGVVKAMAPYWIDKFYNPSSLYEPARRVKQALQSARGDVAKILGAKPSEIVFTAGATEANNLAIFGTATHKYKSSLLTTNIEHESVLEAMRHLHSYGWSIEQLPVEPSGILEIKKLERAITDKTGLISVMYANNEIGTIQPIAQISQLIHHVRQDRQRRKVKRPLYLHTDAAQAANYLDLHVSRLGVDLMTLNGSKIYGPKQSGCLYVRAGTIIEPYIVGGGQEFGLRSGTENVPADIGFAESLKIAARLRQVEAKRLTTLRDDFSKRIINEIEGVSLNGEAFQRLPNNINLSFKGISGETLVHHLDAKGILAATGSACSANNDRPSHVLAAIGLNPKQINSSLRITLGRATTMQQLVHVLEKLKTIVKSLRQLDAKP